MAPSRLSLLLSLLVLTSSACGALLTPEPTPVPGAAATAARADRTPIPTPLRSPTTLAAASPGAAPAPSPSRAASPAAQGNLSTAEEAGLVRGQLEAVFGTPDLPGIESLLTARVPIVTSQGTEVLGQAEAAQWLRDRAAASLRISRMDRSALSGSFQVDVEGWQPTPPLATPLLTLTLRKYAASGQPDDQRGTWKIDTVTGV